VWVFVWDEADLLVTDTAPSPEISRALSGKIEVRLA
jgi:hypothetical protein